MVDKFQQALSALKKGDKKTSHALLMKVLQVNPHDEKAWFAMAYALESSQQQRYCLEKVLLINPHNQHAQKRLIELEAQQTATQQQLPKPQNVVEHPQPTRPRPLPEVVPPLNIPESQVSLPAEVPSVYAIEDGQYWRKPLNYENLWALPVVFLVGLLILRLPLIGQFFGFAVTMILHELGHAITGWFRGVIAIPSFVVTLEFGFSWGFFFLVAAILSAGLIFALWQKKILLLGMSVGGLIMLVTLSLILPHRFGDQLTSFGGLAGELCLSTILILFFYHWNWGPFKQNKNRYFFMGWGFIALSSASAMWWRTLFNPQAIPMGSIIAGRGDSQGDLNRLLAAGWSLDAILWIYYSLTLLCLVTILIHYVYFVWPIIKKIIRL